MVIRKLPHWVLTDKHPAFYDTESVTAVEQTARVYGKMNEFIDAYNKYIDEFNAAVEDFQNGILEDMESFTCKIIKITSDYIYSVDMKLVNQDRKIAELYRQYITDIHTYVRETIEQLIQNGEINETILAAFNDITEDINGITKDIDDLKTYAAFKKVGESGAILAGSVEHETMPAHSILAGDDCTVEETAENSITSGLGNTNTGRESIVSGGCNPNDLTVSVEFYNEGRNVNHGARSIQSGKGNLNEVTQVIQSGEKNVNRGTHTIQSGGSNTNGEKAWKTIQSGTGNVNEACKVIQSGYHNTNAEAGTMVIQSGSQNTNSGACAMQSGAGNKNENAAHCIQSGQNNTNKGANSFQVGSGNTNEGGNSLESGHGNKNYAANTMMSGSGNTNNTGANESTILGSQNNNTGYQALMGGQFGVNTLGCALVHGQYLNSNNGLPGKATVGRFNEDIANALFEVGAGLNKEQRSSPFYVTGDGACSVSNLQSDNPYVVLNKRWGDTVETDLSCQRYTAGTKWAAKTFRSGNTVRLLVATQFTSFTFDSQDYSYTFWIINDAQAKPKTGQIITGTIWCDGAAIPIVLSVNVNGHITFAGAQSKIKDVFTLQNGVILIDSTYMI